MIRSQIGRIEAEGGTVVLRALEATLRQLGQSRAASKHMILLTGGIDGGIFSQDSYRLLVGRIRASGITLSSVAVGGGMHVPLMRNLATWGGGHFYQTSDWREVPGLLAGDTLTQGPPSADRPT